MVTNFQNDVRIRVRFEAHMRPFGCCLTRANGGYVDVEVRGAWSTWRASYAAALDTAAGRLNDLEAVCRRVDAHYLTSFDHKPAFVTLVRAAIAK